MIEYQTARTRMVDCQVRTSDVTDLDIIDAMMEIPREEFVAADARPLAYIDVDLPVGSGAGDHPRYLMDPAHLAKLLQLLQIEKDAIVLDVGCATGYTTALLARLCASVVALENDDALANIATKNLDLLEIGNAVVVTGPLEEGYAKEGPYDSIFVGGAIDGPPEKLIRQLKNGGRLVAVIGAGASAQAKLFIREDKAFSAATHFNCALKSLPGFSKTPEFVF